MKYLKNNFATGLTLLAIIGLIFETFIAHNLIINENLIVRALSSYLISYLAFKISFIETKKVALMFVPLIFHSLIVALVVRGGFSSKIPNDMVKIITNLYRLIVMVGIFFIIELILNRIFGSLVTSILGGLSFLIFLAIISSNRLSVLKNFEDFFLYFSFYVMAIRIRSALRLNPFLLFIAIVLVVGEIYLQKTYLKYNYGFLLSIYPLVYFSLKTISNEQSFCLLDYMLFALIYTYPALFVIIKTSFNIESLAISIIGILASYILGEVIYKIKNTYLSTLILGIS